MRRYFISLFALITIHSNVHGSPRFNMLKYLVHIKCIGCHQLNSDTIRQSNRDRINNSPIGAGTQQLAAIKSDSIYNSKHPDNNRPQASSTEPLYFMFNLSAGRFPLRYLNMFPAVKFNYSNKRDQLNSYAYTDSVHIRPLSSLSGMGFGVEFGSKKGIFFVASAGFMFGRSSINFASIQSGYNIRLPVKGFSIQPSLAYTNITQRVAFSEIPFDGKDIVVFETNFPYKPCACGKSSYMLVKSVNHMKFIQSKITLNYAVSKYVTLKFGYSFWSQISNSSDLILESKSKTKTIYDEVHRAGGVSQDDTTDHRKISIFWETSMLYIFKSTPPSGTSRQRYYHHSSYHGSHFSHGSSHFCH
jgi:hypothetical protein